MPPWRAADEGKIASALDAPRQAFGGEDMYPSIEEKAAVMLYSLAKAHALPNGNKRVAMVSTFFFLAMNGLWWNAQSEEVRVHVTWLAASATSARDEARAYMTAYLRSRLTDVRDHFAAQGIDIDDI